MTLLKIDSREPIAKMAGLAARQDIPYKIQKLDYGDFATNTAVFERKSIHDLIGSIRSTRLFEQMNRMCNFCSDSDVYGFLIVSGSLKDAEKWFEKHKLKLNTNAVWGGIASCMVRYGIGFAWVTNDLELVYLAYKLGEKCDEGKFGVPHRYKLRKAHRNPKIAVIANACRVSPAIAERLYKKFGGLKGVLLAPESKLALIPGVGPVTLARMKSLIE